jgi:hypothetical protein
MSQVREILRDGTVEIFNRKFSFVHVLNPPYCVTCTKPIAGHAVAVGEPVYGLVHVDCVAMLDLTRTWSHPLPAVVYLYQNSKDVQ